MSLTLGLNTALSGLLTAQAGLDVTGHNIANVNTAGYTRKSFKPESRVLNGRGSGVQTGAILRDVDKGLLQSLQKQVGVKASLEMKQTYFGRMQDLFGRPSDNNSITHMVSDLSRELEMLAADPSKSAQQFAAVQAGMDLTQKLRDVTDQLQTLRLEADRQISADVEEVNNLLKAIASLNDKIVREQALANGTTDLEDKRDQAIKSLSEYIDVQYFENVDGAFTIYTTTGASLVMSQAVSVSHNSAVTVNPIQSMDGGDFGGIMAGSTDLTKILKSGRIAALVEMRDKTLPNLQAQVDEMAVRMRDTVNQAHNRGASFPTLMTEATGSRTFVDSSLQTMRFGANSDSVISVIDTTGAPVATVSLRSLMADTAYDDSTGAGTDLTGTAWTLDNVAAKVQDWLRTGPAGLTNAAVSVDSDGHFSIDTASTSRGIAMRDYVADTTTAAQSARKTSTYTVVGGTDTLRLRSDGGADYTVTYAAGTTLTAIAADITANAGNGISASVVTDGNSQYLKIVSSNSEALTITGTLAGTGGLGLMQVASNTSDASVSFDGDGDGNADQTYNGLSNFLGLNDFFVTEGPQDVWESGVLNGNYKAGSSGTLNIVSGGGTVSIAIAQGTSLKSIAQAINDATTDMTAEVVPDGAGYRLRILDDTGASFHLTQNGASQALLTELGLEPGVVGKAELIDVRSDIQGAPERITRPMLQYNSDTGRYEVAAGDNSAINMMADAFTETATFETAGGMASATLTFEGYATSILSNNATAADNIDIHFDYEMRLQESLEMKWAENSAVNLDEEMAKLITFEQAYTAAARVITTTQQMFDVLTNMIR